MQLRKGIGQRFMDEKWLSGRMLMKRERNLRER